MDPAPDTARLCAALLDGNPLVVFAVDADLQVRTIHNRAVFEQWRDMTEPAERLDCGPLHGVLAQLMSPARARQLEAQIRDSAPDAGQLGVFTLFAPRGGAHERHVAATVAAAEDPPGNARLLVLRDITGLHEAQQALAATRLSLDAAMAVLHAPPDALRLFLGSAIASVGAIRATLRMPARNQAALRDKLARLETTTRQLAGEARTVGIDPVREACEQLAARLSMLLQLDCISGDALLPLALLVDDIAGATGTVWRIEEQRYAAAQPATTSVAATAERPARRSADWSRASERRWTGFLRRRGEQLGTLVRFGMEGAALVPAAQRRSIDEMLQHLLLNAVEHGIETPEERLAADKPASGQVTVKFEDRGAAGLRMTVRDDGRGFDVARIGRAAVRCGLVSEESLVERDAGDVVGLVFKPAFTTEGLDAEQGRGRGMPFLRRAVTHLGGQISVATKRGRYTQFTIHIPQAAGMHAPEMHAHPASLDKP